jgi:hypothetical protein
VAHCVGCKFLRVADSFDKFHPLKTRFFL